MAEDGKVVFKYVGDTTGIDGANTEAERKLGGLQSRTSGITAGIARAVGVAAVAAIGSVIKIGASFESSFAGVIKTVDGTDEEIAKLRKDILQMSTELPATADEISAVAASAGQLGIETANITGFTKAMIDLGEATNLTADEAASQLAKFANIVGMPQTEFDKLGSTIVSLGNNFATTEADIVAMGMRLAGAGKQAGMSEADIMGIAAALSSVGIEAESGGSAFSRVMNDMNKAVQLGNEDLAKFADVAGMSAEQFATAFKTDAAGALSAFVTGLGNMEARGSSSLQALDSLGITEIRMTDALLRASGASDVFTKALDNANTAWDENTALTKEADARYATLESRFEMLKNTASGVAIQLYDAMRPALSEVLDSVKEMLTAFSESGTLESFAQTLGSVASTIGNTLVSILPILIDLMNELLPPFAQLIDAVLPPLVENAGMLIEAFSPIIDTVFPALIDIVKQLIVPFSEIAKDIFPMVTGAIDKLLPMAMRLVDIVLPAFMDIVSALAPVLVDLVETGLGAFMHVADALIPPLTDIVESLLPPIIEIVEALLPPLMSIIDLLLGLALDVFDALLPGFLQLVEMLLPSLLELVNSLIIPLVQIVSDLLPALTPLLDLVTQVLGGVMGAIAPILPLLVGLVSKIADFLMPVIEILAKLITGTLIVAFDAISPVIDAVMQVLTGLMDFLTGIFTGDWDRAWRGIVNVFKGILNTIPATVEGIVNASIRILNKLIDGANSVLKFLGSNKTIGHVGLVSLPRFRTGLDKVPTDDYPALLHKDEKVLTAAQAREYRQLEASGMLTGADGAGYNDSSTTITFEKGAVVVQTNSDIATEAGAQDAGEDFMSEIARQMRNRGLR